MRERVTCNWYILVSLPILLSLSTCPLISSNHLYDLFKKRAKEGGGREGARVSQQQLNTDSRAAQNKQKRLDHEHQISIVLTLFFDDLSQKTRWWDMLRSLFPTPCVLY